MKVLMKIARILVGALFVFSGFIKLNDPIGFSYKLQEYFSAQVLNLEFLVPFSLLIAVLLVVFELVLGIMLLIGYLPKFTTWCLLLMILFFTFLTFYSAYFNKVTDCGCFGDAIPLTPWQSFTKDVILLILIVFLFFKHKQITPFLVPASHRWIIFLSFMLCFLFCYHVLMHLPVFDFRPYKVGNNISELRRVPENAQEAVYAYHWKFKTEEGKEIIRTTNGDYPQQEGKFLNVETELLKEGYVPPIHDFTIQKDGKEVTSEILAAPKVLLLVAYNLRITERKGFKKIKILSERALKKGYKVIALTSSGESAIFKLKKDFQLNFDFYHSDETVLKTIVRANPGILVLQKGTITQKKHWSDIDEIEL